MNLALLRGEEGRVGASLPRHPTLPRRFAAGPRRLPPGRPRRAVTPPGCDAGGARYEVM